MAVTRVTRFKNDRSFFCNKEKRIQANRNEGSFRNFIVSIRDRSWHRVATIRSTAIKMTLKCRLRNLGERGGGYKKMRKKKRKRRRRRKEEKDQGKEKEEKEKNYARLAEVIALPWLIRD